MAFVSFWGVIFLWVAFGFGFLVCVPVCVWLVMGLVLVGFVNF